MSTVVMPFQLSCLEAFRTAGGMDVAEFILPLDPIKEAHDLSDPYTGVPAIFAARLLNGSPPLIVEDGLQRRDFVSVHDVARACILAAASAAAQSHAINIGSGGSWTVREIPGRLCRVPDRQDIEPGITGRYRVGDVRHCFADMTAAQSLPGYEPRVSLEEGPTGLAAWLEGRHAGDRVEQAGRELAARGLTV